MWSISAIVPPIASIALTASLVAVWIDAAIDQAIEACGGDLRSTIRALILANEFLEYELQAKVSQGYMRGVRYGRFNTYSG